MAEENFEEKTEQATQQRREDFRKEGQVAQSREVSNILVLVGVLMVFYFMSQDFLNAIESVFKTSFTDYLILAARQGEVGPALTFISKKAFSIIAPVFIVALVMGVGSTLGQIGFLTAWEHIAPDFERINPVKGFGRLFTIRNLVEGAKSILKVVIIGTVTFLIIKKEMTFTPHLAQFTVVQTLSYIGHVLFRLLGGTCALLAILAILDYAFQRWELEKRMKMTKQEVKEEFKQREGDPLIKSRIKRIQRELAQKRMMEDVPKADVIITNPTHIAVAIKYDRATMAAPTLTAKGADLIAEKIKKVAREHNIPVVENKPLARTIFKTMKIGHAIPKSLYHAVAEVLAYVYKIKGKISQVSQDIAREVSL